MFKQNEHETVTDRDLTMCSVGNVCAMALRKIEEKELNPIESLEKGMPYALALRQLMSDKDAEPGMEAITIREALLSYPSIDTAGWDEYALEEGAVRIAANIQGLWRKLSSGQIARRGYREQYQHLPMVFLRWESVQRYVEIAKSIFVRLGVPLDNQQLKKAFYQVAAQEFASYGLDRAECLGDIMRNLLLVDPAISGLNPVDMQYLCQPKHIRKIVTPQFAEHGFGTVQQIAACAKCFDGICDNDPRYVLDRQLEAIMSH